MTNRRLAFPMILALLANAVFSDPGPWKTVTFPVDAGIVSSVAIDGGKMAVGLTSGGIRIVDTAATTLGAVKDPAFGPGGRILSLAWLDGGLWIASQKGLFRYDDQDSSVDREQDGVPPGIKTGVKVMKVHNGVLWCATLKRLARVGAEGRNGYREWFFPGEIDPTCLLRVAGRILVGTASKGLFILDTLSERWVRFGVDDGLSSDQIVALEWVGDQVLVGTSEGVDALELSSLQSRKVVTGIAVAWMTQVNGALFASTLDGLVRIDSRTFERKSVDLPTGFQPEGDLAFASGVLVVGCGNSLAIRSQPTFLGTEGLRPVPEGFGVRIPKPLPQGVQLQALLRLPEWPAVKVPIGVSTKSDGCEVVLAMPPETKGRVQIDFLAVAGNRVLETRSVEGDGDRSKPVLVLDPVPSITRGQELTLSGTVAGVGPLSLSLLQSGRNLSVGSMGEFRQKVKLARGENRLEIRLRDALGVQLGRDLVVRMDDRAPQILGVPYDTVEGTSIRIRIPYRDESEVKVSVDPVANARLSVSDSFVVVEARNLVAGDNSWRIGFVDEAGNASNTVVHAWRNPSPTEEPPKSAATGTSTPATGPGKPTNARPCDDSAKRSIPAIHVVRYRMESDETIRAVARKFYGSREMDAILIRWNGLGNSRSKPANGAMLEIPFWKGFEYGQVDAADALEHFPWDDAPSGQKVSP